ncbi:unnamed protein product [Ranitomeya imitator]|uniref:Tc1-like transposase DDE domain-containing protein n=1 Tax=Ranitomeya imitator TaxID=111125 RepID=A0ABN9LZN6_9NEOB|nr:unnamed protein product [Ranitomeya imitator]
MVKRNPFTTANQVTNTLQEVGVSISKSTIKRRLHETHTAYPKEKTKHQTTEGLLELTGQYGSNLKCPPFCTDHEHAGNGESDEGTPVLKAGHGPPWEKLQLGPIHHSMRHTSSLGKYSEKFPGSSSYEDIQQRAHHRNSRTRVFRWIKSLIKYFIKIVCNNGYFCLSFCHGYSFAMERSRERGEERERRWTYMDNDDSRIRGRLCPSLIGRGNLYDIIVAMATIMTSSSLCPLLIGRGLAVSTNQRHGMSTSFMTSSSLCPSLIGRGLAASTNQRRGISRTDRPNVTLTTIRYQDEILRPIVILYASALGPGFLLMQDNVRLHVAEMCQQFLHDEGIEAMDWPARSPALNPIEHIWDIMSRSIHQRHVAPQTVQELTDALIHFWELIILYPECQCHYPVPRVSVSLSCTPSVSVIILYPECQCHYPVPRVSASLSCTPNVSVIILYPECQCHYPVPRVSVSLSCTSSVSVIILYPECQRHYVPVVLSLCTPELSLSCTPSVSVIILYPECQCHYPVPRVSVSLSCTPSVSVIILYPECQRHYPVPRVSVSLSCTPSDVPPDSTMDVLLPLAGTGSTREFKRSCPTPKSSVFFLSLQGGTHEKRLRRLTRARGDRAACQYLSPCQEAQGRNFPGGESLCSKDQEQGEVPGCSRSSRWEALGWGRGSMLQGVMASSAVSRLPSDFRNSE